MRPPVLDLLNRLSSAIENKDLDAATVLFCDEAILSGSSEEELAVDDGIRRFLDLVLGIGVTIRWDWHEPVVRGVEGVCWFYVDGVLHVTGAKPTSYRAFGVVRQQDGDWRFGQWSGAEPA